MGKIPLDEAARLAGMDPQELHRRILLGEIPAERVDDLRFYLLKRKDVEALARAPSTLFDPGPLTTPRPLGATGKRRFFSGIVGFFVTPYLLTPLSYFAAVLQGCVIGGAAQFLAPGIGTWELCLCVAGGYVLVPIEFYALLLLLELTGRAQF